MREEFTKCDKYDRLQDCIEHGLVLEVIHSEDNFQHYSSGIGTSCPKYREFINAVETMTISKFMETSKDNSLNKATLPIFKKIYEKYGDMRMIEAQEKGYINEFITEDFLSEMSFGG